MVETFARSDNLRNGYRKLSITVPKIVRPRPLEAIVDNSGLPTGPADSALGSTLTRRGWHSTGEELDHVNFRCHN